MADTEYDLASGVIRLMRTSGCSNHQLAYWAAGKPYNVMDILPSTQTRVAPVTVMVSVNGTRIKALMDTGAPASLLSLSAAKRAGVATDGDAVIQRGIFGRLRAASGERLRRSPRFDQDRRRRDRAHEDPGLGHVASRRRHVAGRRLLPVSPGVRRGKSGGRSISPTTAARCSTSWPSRSTWRRTARLRPPRRGRLPKSPMRPSRSRRSPPTPRGSAAEAERWPIGAIIPPRWPISTARWPWRRTTPTTSISARRFASPTARSSSPWRMSSRP